MDSNLWPLEWKSRWQLTHDQVQLRGLRTSQIAVLIVFLSPNKTLIAPGSVETQFCVISHVLAPDCTGTL